MKKVIIVSTNQKAVVKTSNEKVSTLILTDDNFNHLEEYNRISGVNNIRVVSNGNFKEVLPMTKIEQLFKNEEIAYLNATSIQKIDECRFNLKMLGYEESEIQALDEKRNKLDDEKTIVIIKDLYCGTIKNCSIDEILEIVNSDRSADWTDYDVTDWLEGFSAWEQGNTHVLIDII